jgi:hypothetical protein
LVKIFGKKGGAKMINKIRSMIVSSRIDTYTIGLIALAFFLSLLYLENSWPLIIIVCFSGGVITFIKGIIVRQREYFIWAMCLIVIGVIYFLVFIDAKAGIIIGFGAIIVLSLFYNRYSEKGP